MKNLYFLSFFLEYYLLSLNQKASQTAEEYIRKTPKQINTELRSEIEERLTWKFLENN